MPTTTTEVKLCKDCKWCAMNVNAQIRGGPVMRDVCMCQDEGIPDYVTGKRYWTECRGARKTELDNHCGPSGRFWEAKE